MRLTPWLVLLWLGAMSPVQAQVRTVATPTVEPAAVRIGAAEKVRLWADISDPNVIASGVNLLQVGAPGTNPTVVGVLKDDGTGGDEIAGDGRYTIELLVNEPAAKTLVYRISAPFKGTLLRTVTPDLVLAVVANRVPVAVPGANQAVRTGALVQLDGRTSYDLDGDLLHFRWTLTRPAGSAAVLDSASHVKPSFSADVAGSYQVQLVVNDGQSDSVAQELTVEATPGNAAPTARPTALRLPFGAGATTSVPLAGAGSDPESQPLTLAWALRARPATSTTASLSTAVPPQLLADKPGRYVVELTVNDGTANSAPVSSVITLYRPNTPPTVDAGADPVGQPTGSVVNLAGSASDADGDSLTAVRWAFIAKPAGSGASLGNPATLTPRFTADQPGDYLIEFSVTDSKGATGTARVVVRAVTLPPVTLTSLIADPASGTVPLTVRFQSQASGGTGTFGYGWTFGDNGTGSTQNPQHVYTQPGSYIATVTATDTQGGKGQRSVTIVANPAAIGNTAPKITQAAATVTLPLSLDLDPTVTDDGLPNPPAALTYGWTQVSGPAGQPPAPPTAFAAATFSSTTTRATKVTFDPTGPGTYVLRLTVSDGALSTSLDVTVTVAAQPQTPPAIGPLPNQTIRLGETLSIAVAGNDLNAKDALTYALLAAPSGANLAPAGSPRFVFTPAAGQVGTHNVTVQVRDGTNRTAQSSFTVTVQNANRAPQFTAASRANATTSIGANYARLLVATDPDAGDALTYELLSGPGGLSISATGALTWSPSPSQRGDHLVKVKVSDLVGAADFALFTLTVGNNLPPIARDDVYEVRVNALLTVDAASGVLANDADPDTGGNAGLTARKLTDPPLGSLTSFAGDGSFSYQAPATPPGESFTMAKEWNAKAGSDRFHELVADLNRDGYPDIISFDNNAGIRARSGQDGSELWSADRTGAADCQLNSGHGSMDSRVLADIDDSGHPSLVQTTYCGREGSSWHDNLIAFDHLGKVKWVSPPLSKPHPDIRRGATPVPPGGFTPGGVALGRGLSIARLTAGGPPVLLMRAEIPVGNGYSYYVDAANVGHYAGCRAVTGLAADEDVACRATFLISGTDGSVLQTLVARNPAAVPHYGGPSGLSEMPPIAMDIDGDGRVDLVSGTEVWMQNARGGFDLSWQLAKSVNDTAVADLDGDGKAEIIHFRSSGEPDVDQRGIFVYSHDGQLKRHIPLWAYFVTPLTIADVDGDGRSDIVLGADGTVYAFRDDGRPIWAHRVPPDVPTNPVFAPFYPQPPEYYRVSNATPQVYDLDGDGVAEVVFAAHSRISVLDGRTGLRKLDPFWTFNFSSQDISALMLIDMNNDGHVDIVQNSSFIFNCLFVGADFLSECYGLVGPIALSGGGSNHWLPGPRAFPHVQYRSTAIDGSARVLHDTKVSRLFRTPEQQGTVRDPRLAQAASFTYEATDGSAGSAPARVIVNIAPENKPPVFTSVPPKSLWQHFAPNPPGGLVTHYYDLTAYDPDAGDTITYSLKAAPSWVTMSGPARVRFEPTCGSYGYPCPWGWTTVIVTATDSRGASTDQIFIVNLTTTAVTVPSVVGLSYEAAKSALRAQELQGVQWVESFSAQPAGTVLAQDAVAGAVVGRFDDIRMTVSKGPAPVLVPNVVGKVETSATSQLANAGFAVAVSRQFSTAIAAGLVISQSPSGGTTTPPGTARLVVSSGNGLALKLSRGLMPANESIVARPIASDVDGNPVATPSLAYAIKPKQTPFTGTLPTIVNQVISAGATTMGAFVVTATDAATGRTATAEFAVALPTDANGEGSSASIARFLAVLQQIDDFGPALRAARAANDVPQMKALLGQIVTLWRTIDLDDLKDSMVIVFAQGFVPSRRDMDAFGLQPTGDDLLIRQVMRDAAADLDAWTQALRGSGTSLATLDALADQFAARAARIDALTVSEYGVVLSQPEYQLLIAHRIPAFYEAVIEEAAELAGLPRRSSAFPLRKRAPASHAGQLRAPLMKSTLAELAVTQAVGYITDKIVEKGLETYKNAKKFATDVMKQAAWGAGAVAIAAHVRQLAYGSSIIETVSGASLSFRVFNAPYTFIEVITNDEPSLNDVMIIGPDITDNTFAAVKGLLDAIKDGFSFGKDALTNPKRYRNQDEAQKTKKELRKRVKALQDGAQGLFDVTSSMYQSPDEVERGCIFDANPDCRQLHYGSGFASVYSYSPPPGFLCYSGLPLPIPIIVQDQVSGLMYFGTPAFLPTPKGPPPNCP